MSLKTLSIKLANHIARNKWIYSSIGAILIFFAIYVFRFGIPMTIYLPMQSISGVGFFGVNVGVILMVIGGLILFAGIKAKKGAGMLMLGFVLFLSGFLMTGSSILQQVLTFFDKTGLQLNGFMGQLIVTAVVFIILVLVIK